MTKRFIRTTTAFVFLIVAMSGANLLRTAHAQSGEDDVLSREGVWRDPEVPALGNPDGDVTVVEYFDYQCPICKHFEVEAGAALDQMVAKNQITLVYHPLAFLDRMSSTQYSTRSAASSGCASDRGQFLPYTKALFNNQPAEGSNGLSDDRLVQMLKAEGVDIARRTIAKYRESLRIPSSTERRRQRVLRAG